MAGSGATLTPSEYLVRHGGAYLGYLSTRVALKRCGRAKVPTTRRYSWLVLARTIINNVVPLTRVYAIVN